MNANQRKKHKINLIIDALKNSKKEELVVIKEKLIAQVCISWGVARRTALEYIDTIVQAEVAKEYKLNGESVIEINNGETQFKLKSAE